MSESIFGYISLISGFVAIGLALSGSVFTILPLILSVGSAILAFKDYLAYKWSSVLGLLFSACATALLIYMGQNYGLRTTPNLTAVIADTTPSASLPIVPPATDPEYVTFTPPVVSDSSTAGTPIIIEQTIEKLLSDEKNYRDAENELIYLLNEFDGLFTKATLSVKDNDVAYSFDLARYLGENSLESLSTEDKNDILLLLSEYTQKAWKITPSSFTLNFYYNDKKIDSLGNHYSEFYPNISISETVNVGELPYETLEEYFADPAKMEAAKIWLNSLANLADIPEIEFSVKDNDITYKYEYPNGYLISSLPTHAYTSEELEHLCNIAKDTFYAETKIRPRSITYEYYYKDELVDSFGF